jgi:fatty acid amide hydrolase
MCGHWTVPNFALDWVQPGPIARHVADLTLALRVLAAPGQEAFDPRIAPAPLGDPGSIAVRKLRIGTYDYDGQFAAAPALRRAVHEAAAALREQGAQIEDFRPPDVPEAVRIYYGLVNHDGLACLRRVLRKNKLDWSIKQLLLGVAMPNLLRPLLSGLFRLLGHHYHAQFYRFVRRRTLSFTAYWRLVEEQTAYRVRFLQALEEQRLDALLCPPTGLPALCHGCYYGTPAGSYSFLYNLLGMPAGVVAATRVRPGEESDRPPSKDPVVKVARAVEEGSAGLPVGVQVVARHWRDAVALAVMAALEEHFRKQPDYPARPPL